MRSSLQEAIWSYLRLPSVILEVCLQALRLATLNALPVPMLRQVYARGSRGPQKGDFARDIFKKREDGDANSYARGSKIAISLGTSSKNGKMTMSARCCSGVFPSKTSGNCVFLGSWRTLDLCWGLWGGSKW